MQWNSLNHESPIRGETFVTRKITRALARIRTGLQETLFLGNLDAKRDWGHARDYVEAQWLVLQQEEPDDYVIATGVQYSVRQFVERAAHELGLAITWEGEGIEEIGRISAIEQEMPRRVGDVIVRIDPRYFRPTEVETLLGDATKARQKLGWEPAIRFDELVKEMVLRDLDQAKRFSLLKREGFKTHQRYE